MSIPSVEQAPAAATALEAAIPAAEHAAAAELAPLPGGSAAASAALPTTIPLPPPVPAPGAPAAASATATATYLPAEDRDIIEKEWVLKAKQIVERTRNDPHKQSEDLTLFKADYMKKRYGKTIKISR